SSRASSCASSSESSTINNRRGVGTVSLSAAMDKDYIRGAELTPCGCTGAGRKLRRLKALRLDNDFDGFLAPGHELETLLGLSQAEPVGNHFADAHAPAAEQVDRLDDILGCRGVGRENGNFAAPIVEQRQRHANALCCWGKKK